MASPLLLDENLSERLVMLLADRFPECQHVRLLGQGGASDATLWELAKSGRRLLVTKDEDFIAMSILRGAPPKVVWLNIGNASTASTASLLLAQADAIEAFAAHHDATFLALTFSG